MDKEQCKADKDGSVDTPRLGFEMGKEQLYYQVAFAHLTDQDDRNKQLERKATAALTLSAALVGVGAILIKDFSVSPTALSEAVLWIAASVMVMFFFVVGLTFHVLKVREWRRDPGLQKFPGYIHDDEYTPDAMVEWVGDAYADSFTHNERLIHAKVWGVNWAFIALVSEVTLLAFLAFAIRF
ncbi:MAG: hypothetical protein QGI09_03785 [Dehalococcoidia bacterium]|jgi:hypothetical protein|nr:hypothetical protein [Dehalococcoidia bacterium]